MGLPEQRQGGVDEQCSQHYGQQTEAYTEAEFLPLRLSGELEQAEYEGTWQNEEPGQGQSDAQDLEMRGEDREVCQGGKGYDGGQHHAGGESEDLHEATSE